MLALVVNDVVDENSVTDTTARFELMILELVTIKEQFMMLAD
jgi:hypothetical protein